MSAGPNTKYITAYNLGVNQRTSYRWITPNDTPAPLAPLKTEKFRKELEDRLNRFQFLTSGQSEGIHREVLQAEALWLIQQAASEPTEYDEIIEAQEAFDKLKP